MTTPQGKDNVRARLLKGENPNDRGTWKILGEDPNADMGGTHIQPDLGTVTGTYKDAVEYALSLNGFIGWGYGGDIKRAKPTLNLDGPDPQKLAALRAERELLTERLRQIADEITAILG